MQKMRLNSELNIFIFFMLIVKGTNVIFHDKYYRNYGTRAQFTQCVPGVDEKIHPDGVVQHEARWMDCPIHTRST